MNVVPTPAKPFLDALLHVHDPEFGLNVVDLGLIYDVEVNAHEVVVTHSLTSPHCPAGEIIHHGILAALEAVSEGKPVRVELTWEPAWSPERLSPAARDELGWA